MVFVDFFRFCSPLFFDFDFLFLLRGADLPLSRYASNSGVKTDETLRIRTPTNLPIRDKHIYDAASNLVIVSW